MGICYIFGAAEFKFDRTPTDGDLIIAADAGYTALKESGIKPDIAVGDFDSLGYVPDDVFSVRYPVAKDDTDMLLSVRLGLDKGFKKFMLYGGTGGRLEHTVANIQLLSLIVENGAAACLVGCGESIIMLKNERMYFSGYNGAVSVFAYGGTANGVYLTDMTYPLDCATLTTDYPIGVSNRTALSSPCVRVDNGKLLVLFNGSIDNTDYFTKQKR